MSTKKQTSAKDKPTAAKERAKGAAAKKSADAPQSRSEAIAASWGDKKVAAARSLKHKVKVGGTEYNSVADAFRQLKLPMGHHIRFRMELKAAGKKVYETAKGVKHIFTLVQQD